MYEKKACIEEWHLSSDHKGNRQSTPDRPFEAHRSIFELRDGTKARNRIHGRWHRVRLDDAAYDSTFELQAGRKVQNRMHDRRRTVRVDDEEYDSTYGLQVDKRGRACMVQWHDTTDQGCAFHDIDALRRDRLSLRRRNTLMSRVRLSDGDCGNICGCLDGRIDRHSTGPATSNRRHVASKLEKNSRREIRTRGR